MRRSNGFTLIELMIVVAIIGILTAIGYPSYKDSVYKARRADLKAEMLKIGTAQEKFFARSAQYARTLGTGAGGLGWNADPFVTDDGFYSIAVTNSPATGRATTYLLTATALGDQQADKCDGYTLSNLGKKTVSEGTNAVCWDR